jgi:hypothetical protein
MEVQVVEEASGADYRLLSRPTGKKKMFPKDRKVEGDERVVMLVHYIRDVGPSGSRAKAHVQGSLVERAEKARCLANDILAAPPALLDMQDIGKCDPRKNLGNHIMPRW